MMIHNSILDLIGNTPMVRIRKLNPNPNVELVAKLEWCNPLGSVKERIALNMIRQAEQDGTLTKDKTIIESSSGNTGIGLAMVGAVLGYKVVITMSKGVSMERRKIMRSLGAELIMTSREGGSDEAWDKADQLYAENPKKFARLHQYRSLANQQAHEENTAEEIWTQTDGQLDCIVATLGTTGTIMGLSRRLKSRNPDIRIVSVEPPPGKHRQQGIRNVDYSRTPMIWDPGAVDERLIVSDEDALNATRDLMRREGLFAGISSGSALVGAQTIASRMESGRIVVIFPDHGYKYLSTDLFPAEDE